MYDTVLASFPAELGLLVAIGCALLALHPAVIIVACVIVLAKLVVERLLRWPFVPAALALAAGIAGWNALAWALLAVALLFVVAFPHSRGPPAFTGPYGVAYIDAHLKADGCAVLVRALYPIDSSRPGLAAARYYAVMGREMCDALMALAPFPLNSGMFGFLLYPICLVRAHLRRGGDQAPMAKEVAKSSEGAPVVIFSNGILGSREQSFGVVGELVSRGMVVLCVEHTDRTAALARLPNGETVPFDVDLVAQEYAGLWATVWHVRRTQVDTRSLDFATLVRCVRALGRAGGEPGVVSAGPSDAGGAAEFARTLGGRLDASRIILAGHSMGAVTAIAAACRVSPPVRAILCLDPATTWLPDEASRVAFCGLPDSSGRVLLQMPGSQFWRPSRTSLEDVLAFVVFSDGWARYLQEGNYHAEVKEHLASGHMAPGSEFVILAGLTHMSFTDIASLMPLWLVHRLGMVDSAMNTQRECLRIRSHLLRFLEAHGLCPVTTPTGPAALIAGLAAESGNDAAILERAVDARVVPPASNAKMGTSSVGCMKLCQP